MVRQAVTIPSDSETLQGWLYLPSSYQPGTKLPGIVTANALTGIKEINLVQYAERFAAAGFATLVFDYRYWGESSGEPRFHVAPMEFRADIRAALDFLAARPEVDANRIGGWGISMGGQNMLFLATLGTSLQGHCRRSHWDRTSRRGSAAVSGSGKGQVR